MSLNTEKEKNTGLLLTHLTNKIDFFDISEYQKKLASQKELALPLEEELELLKQLTEFELGRFLLANKGLNGLWTAYIILHGRKKTNLHPLENWLIHSAPGVKATQERFAIFQQLLQQQIKDNIQMASIPCGLMDDLLSLNFQKCKNIQLIGIDLDNESLLLAKKNAENYNYQNVEFIQKNAWNLEYFEIFDVITSNGLNIYQPDNESVIALYQEFHKALKPNGIFITSFLTPPPTASSESPWENFQISDVLKQKAIFVDIIQANWQALRTERQTKEQLEKAGFEVLQIIYDTQKMFPTVIARK